MLLRGACSRFCACFLLSLLSASSIANGAAAITSTATATAISYCPFPSPFFILSSSTSSTMKTIQHVAPALVHIPSQRDGREHYRRKAWQHPPHGRKLAKRHISPLVRYKLTSACEAIRGIFAAFLFADLHFHWLTHSITIHPPPPKKNKKIGKRQSNPSRTLTKRRANTTCSNSPLHAGTLQNRWPTVCRRR